MPSRTTRLPSRGANASQLARQWGILRMLESRAYSIRELAQTLGASKASIQRDLDTLQHHFMIVATSAGAQKRVYRLERGMAPRAFKLHPEELRALEKALECDGHDGERLRSLYLKLSALLEE